MRPCGKRLAHPGSSMTVARAAASTRAPTAVRIGPRSPTTPASRRKSSAASAYRWPRAIRRSSMPSCSRRTAASSARRWRRQLASRQLQVESAPARLLLHEHLRRSHQPRRRVCPRGRCPLGLARWRRNFSKLHTPHGDNHIVWVNPNDPNVLLEGNDGGATVSTDGGKTWSTEHNQPTGQFYHVALDEQFPFHIYGAQQDEGSFEGPSATSEGMVPLS